MIGFILLLTANFFLGAFAGISFGMFVIRKSLEEIEQQGYERGRSDCPCLNKYKRKRK